MHEMTVSLDDVRRVLDRPVPSPEAERHAAVAAVLTPSLHLLFMRRTEREGDPWSGHVSFPGGRMDPGDETPLHAAIRETEEEIGLQLDRAHLLGLLEPVAPVSGLLSMAIHPFVFALDREPEGLRPNYEVASLHRLSLHDLLADVGRGPMQHSWRGMDVTLPRVDFDGQRLWGLTLRIVDDLLDRLDGRGQGLARLDSRA